MGALVNYYTAIILVYENIIEKYGGITETK
jgi:hypothetical protein